MQHFNHHVTESLGKFITYKACTEYCPLLMEGWQYTAAFVIRFGPKPKLIPTREEGCDKHIGT